LRLTDAAGFVATEEITTKRIFASDVFFQNSVVVARRSALASSRVIVEQLVIARPVTRQQEKEFPMRLQIDLHLPTRQRNDGHHETQTSLRPLHPRRIRSLITRSLAATAAVTTISLPHTASADPKPVGTWGWTTGSATYVRIRPGSQTPAVAKVVNHTQLMVWGTYNGWYRVETTDHKFGWIYHDYVNVPKADKLHELSHFKAKKASDQTGHQMLYGRPEQLKKYYANYGASGAKRGLAKQGIRIVSGTPAKTNHSPVVKTVSSKAPAKAVKKTVAPRTITAKIPETNLPPRMPREVALSEKAPSPRPVVIRANTVQTSPEPKTASTSQPNISAADIMSARAEYLRRQPSARHKTRPSVKPQQAPTPETKEGDAEQNASTQPTAYQTNGDAVVSNAVLQTSPTPVKNGETSSASPINGQAAGYQTIGYSKSKTSDSKSASPSRGGSPRDAARWAAANKKFGSGMANQALSYRGRPYISGAANPSRGFDCSGLVYYLLRQRGYNPPRTAAGLSHFGKPVAKKDLKPGDIVFFANTYKRGVSHVGIYIGNNNFVHAANHRSGVKTDSLSSSYYSRKYYGARRVK
jgi:cell wall-associated NlpC family hydrolase